MDAGRIQRGLHLDHPDGAEDADILNARQRPGRGQFGLKLSLDAADSFSPVVALQQIQTGACGGAGQGIGHEGGAVHQHAGRSGGDGLGDCFMGDRGGEGDVAAGQGLAETKDVGDDVDEIHGEHPPGAAKARGDFVEDQQDAVGVAQGAQAGQIGGVIEAHPARALNHGFEDEGGDPLAVRLKKLRRLGKAVAGRVLVPVGVEGDRRGGDEVFDLQGATVLTMHAGVGIAQAHRLPGVAVIAAAHGGEGGAGGKAARHLGLQSHL